MICIYCKTDAKYKDRTSGKCPKCRKPFAFEPKTGDRFTDGAFGAAIDRVSAGGKVRWNLAHLYYEICRLHFAKDKTRGCVWVFGAILNLGLAVALKNVFLVFGLLPLGLAWAFWGRSRPPFVPIEWADFEKNLWKKWERAHGTPSSLIVRPPMEEMARHKEKVSADVGNYSFDRAVITDRNKTADLLLANNFHFENNCAVLSSKGYPEHVFATAMAMLRRNPKLEVFVLHDATPEGCALAHALRTDLKWFGGTTAAIVDVGLRPGQAGPFRGLFLPAGGAFSPVGLDEKESAWLKEYRLELAALRPEQTLKRLFRAVARRHDAAADGSGDGSSGTVGSESLAATAEGGGDFGSGAAGGGGATSGWETDSDSFGSDAGDSDGGGDSFG